VVSASVIWQTLLMAGARISLTSFMLRNLIFPSSFEMRISSIGHLAGVSVSAVPSDCLYVGTSRMCPDGIYISVSIPEWLLNVTDRHGVSSHTRRTKTAMNGGVVSVDEASAWRIAFLILSGSYSEGR